MRNYSKSIKNQPQTQPIIGRTDMVKNNAGGYVFKVSDKEQLERFLLLGTEGGTYYAKEQQLTQDNAKTIIELIKKDGVEVVKTVVEFSTERKAPKADAGIFVLALVASFGDQLSKQAAYRSVSTVCVTSTHLFTFIANIQNLRGWSRGLRNGVAKFYESKNEQQLAYQLVKYRQRNGFTHRDAMRLAHPKTTNERINSLFKYAVDKIDGLSVDNHLIQTFTMAQTAKESKDLVPLIESGKLTWEMIPTELLNDTDVLTMLLNFMPMTALIRNLNRYSYNGLTEGNSEVTQKIAKRLTNEEEVKKAGIHPVNVINAMKTYEKGQGDKGSKTWRPNQKVLDAMAELYELSVKHTEASNKAMLVGCDVSGSMSTPVSGMSMSCSTLAQVLAATLLKVEPNVQVINFDTNTSDFKFGKRSSLSEILRYSPNGGGTDCALPIQYALKHKLKLDAIVILTDNETWAGRQHAIQALRDYRKAINPNVKVIEIAMAANPSTQFPADDKNVLRVVGFDNSVLDLISKFVG